MSVRIRPRAVLAALQLLLLLSAAQQLESTSPWANTSTGFAPDVSLADGWDAPYPAYEGLTPLPVLVGNGTDGGDDTGPDLASRAAKDFYLRVMPLGASITQGIHSTDGNGYRKWLRQRLRWAGWKVNSESSLKAY